ncbi:MAG: phenylalanine--tRNA ligase subunit beta [Propionibacteriaceae bacterium]|jgi:phenylalanyl-tRNA synthetase beta chain|nr:phenylalanine--tRNA ligase subunit beta [Propionibacteriaceae bacterium]
MRAPISWLREYADIPADVDGRQLAEVLVRTGLEVEAVDEEGAEITGPLVIGRILAFVDEPQKNGKVIRWVQVDVGPEHNQPDERYPQGCRSVVCGAHNFAVGDRVVVSLPGTTLPGGFTISARKTYGHMSDGMICAEDELGIGHDHTGIIVLPERDDFGNELHPGDDPAGVLYLRDTVLDIDVSPDMGYCLSIRGLAREAAIGLDVPFRDVIDKETPAELVEGYPVVLESEDCPLFVAVRVRGIDPARKSPRWMARRLAMAGMRSISLAVDITNYVMLETGQPLHGYDANALQGPIVVRKAREGETLTTLDDQLRQLHPDDLLITDDRGPIGLAGVMGGATTELNDATTDVLIEAANFSPRSIGWTLRRQNLPSEASKRFHRGVDPAAAYSAAHLAAKYLVELAGGTLDELETVAGSVPVPHARPIDADLPARILGADVPPTLAAELLRKSGVKVELIGSSKATLAAEIVGSAQHKLKLTTGEAPKLDLAVPQTMAVTPPTWRPDLNDPYDFVEEVGRKFGFDNIPSVPPIAPPGRGYTKSQRLTRVVSRAAAAAGFVEVISFPFISEGELDSLQIPADDERRNLVRLANPLAETQPFLRTTMIPGLISAAARNLSRGNEDLALFETGSTFFAGSGQAAPIPAVDHRPSDEELAEIAAALPPQPKHFGALLAGNWIAAGWEGPAVQAGWEQAFALVDTVALAVGLEVKRVAAKIAPFHPGRCAAITAAGETIGYAGELHPSVVAAFGLPERAAAVELDLDKLIALAPDGGDVASISTHPVAKEDVALVVDEEVPAGAVLEALREGAGKLLESIELFDVYRGESVPAGKKSLAYAMRFRADDRTLTEAETSAAKELAVAEAAKLGAVQRV